MAHFPFLMQHVQTLQGTVIDSARQEGEIRQDLKQYVQTLQGTVIDSARQEGEIRQDLKR